MASDSSTLAVDPHYAEFIDRMVASGRYPDASAAVNAALQLLEDQELLRELKLAKLREALAEGDDRGEDITADEHLAELDALIAGMPD